MQTEWSGNMIDELVEKYLNKSSLFTSNEKQRLEDIAMNVYNTTTYEYSDTKEGDMFEFHIGNHSVNITKGETGVIVKVFGRNKNKPLVNTNMVTFKIKRIENILKSIIQ